MEREPSPEIDDELFNEVYGKEYTGPPQSNANSFTPKGDSNKRPFSGSQSDEENEPQDPNAVPTDFTSREAKVWEAKAKATERNWKKRKEEEMICKICGESGHFTQGCPSTLGPNRKTADFFERVPARDKNVRALFSEKVISQIEKNIGCRIKMDEKFLIVSGKDRLILSKGVDAVHKMIQDDKCQKKSPTNSSTTRSRSPDGSPKGPHLKRPESQQSHLSPRNTSRFHGRGFSQEKVVGDHSRHSLPKFPIDSPQAYANDGGKGCPARSKSPMTSNFGGDALRSYDGQNHNTGMHKSNNWGVDGRGKEPDSDRKFDFPNYPQMLEELEMKMQWEAAEAGRIRDLEEDEENYKHRECIRELRQNYMSKLANMRGLHKTQWEEFLQLDIQRKQQACQTAYNQPVYSDYDQSSRNLQYAGSGMPVDSRNRYLYRTENYSAPRPQDGYGEFQHQRQGMKILGGLMADTIYQSLADANIGSR